MKKRKKEEKNKHASKQAKRSPQSFQALHITDPTQSPLRCLFVVGSLMGLYLMCIYSF